jgi:hypothetical protein
MEASLACRYGSFRTRAVVLGGGGECLFVELVGSATSSVRAGPRPCRVGLLNECGKGASVELLVKDALFRVHISRA